MNRVRGNESLMKAGLLTSDQQRLNVKESVFNFLVTFK